LPCGCRTSQPGAAAGLASIARNARRVDCKKHPHTHTPPLLPPTPVTKAARHLWRRDGQERLALGWGSGSRAGPARSLLGRCRSRDGRDELRESWRCPARPGFPRLAGARGTGFSVAYPSIRPSEGLGPLPDSAPTVVLQSTQRGSRGARLGGAHDGHIRLATGPPGDGMMTHGGLRTWWTDCETASHLRARAWS
jgi:hypothetical protein